MPRKSRIDAPGALHHVIIRGIERWKIFQSDYDRKNVIKRLAELILLKSAWECVQKGVRNRKAKVNISYMTDRAFMAPGTALRLKIHSIGI
jgi:hypothetical protein